MMPVESQFADQVGRLSLREQVSDRLLTGIFEKRFASGQRLVVQAISALYGVSPTPVRESLVELAGLGLVDLLPNRGAVVKPFGPQELKDMSQVRRVLEAEAAACACGRIDPSELGALLDELGRLAKQKPDAQRDRRARGADTALHSLIARHCGNDRLAAEIGRYLMLFRVLRNLSHLRDSWNDYRRSNDVPEHLKIVKALIRRDRAAAAQAMHRHIRSVEKTLANSVFAE
jgi:DNA-binding GntR family transcriptional regulator